MALRDFIATSLDGFCLDGEEIRRTRPPGERRREDIEEYLNALPQEFLTEEEEALREAVLEYLSAWPKATPPQLSDLCQIGSEATDKIVFARWRLLPRYV